MPTIDRPRPTVGTRKPLKLDELIQKQPSWLQRDLQTVQKYEAVILKALQDPEQQALFARDPAALLTRLKVPISGALRQKLRSDNAARDVTTPVAIRLPNGQVLRPKINVRFKKGK